jgi:Cytochrome P460
MQRFYSIITLFLLSCFGAMSLAEDTGVDTVDVARFDDDGNLIRPGDIDEWVFLGSSLGMGYSQAEFDPGSPGMFQIVRMEPRAYKAFVETGRFIDGTMIALHFYGSQNKVSINRAGFVMGSLHFMEIHYKDSVRFPDGFNFYTFDNDQSVAEEVPLPNECVACHKKDGAYDGVFVQFYPTIHKYLPADVLSVISDLDGSSGH